MAKRIKDLFMKVRLYIFLLGTVALNVLMVNIDRFLSNVYGIYAVIIIVVLVDLIFIGYVTLTIVTRRGQKKQLQDESVESEEEPSLLNEEEVSTVDDEMKQWEQTSGEVHYKQELNGFKTYSNKMIDASDIRYNSPENLYEYVNELSVFMLSKGIEVSKNCIREMLASLAASKVILFTHKDVDIATKTVDALFEFIGFECKEYDVSIDNNQVQSLFQQGSHFYRFLQYADSYRNRLQVLSITKTNVKDIDEHFKPIIKYAVDPLLPLRFHPELKNEFTVSRNTWMAFICSTNEEALYSKDLAEGAITIALDSDLIETDTNGYELKEKMKYEMFRDLLEDSYEEFYMDESFWKKIDELENYLKKYTSFSIDNRLFRQIERFASIFLAFGGEKVDVIDAIIYSKLIHLFKQLDFSELIREKQDVLIEVDKIFGLENLYRSKPILKDILEKQNDAS